ncbi:MAG: NAD(P)-dependent glycerol-3-phosphate dehydrogenase [Candidatus Kapabacteria bacterium]|nr:NAD(P)-dependent glycerol-3-phosphate dehydrogenase [Candidatus Kapabacteria bacterium]
MIDEPLYLKKIVVVGAGGWGTALALLLKNKGYSPVLYSYDSQLIESIKQTRQNLIYLKDIEIEDLELSSDSECVNQADVVINTVPTQFIRQFYKKNNINLTNKILINGSKGLENETFHTISQIFTSEYNVHLETSNNKNLAKSVQDLFSTELFRVYTATDLIGCEIGGSLKNVIAIASGIVSGMGIGDNARAALITRGLAEITRLGVQLGANPMTFSGLSGLGDLFVTCDSKHSRNRTFGERIGMGQSTSQILFENKMVTEGVYTSKSAYLLSLKLGIDLPITYQVYSIIYENKKPTDAIKDLFNRDAKQEIY